MTAEQRPTIEPCPVCGNVPDVRQSPSGWWTATCTTRCPMEMGGSEYHVIRKWNKKVHTIITNTHTTEARKALVAGEEVTKRFHLQQAGFTCKTCDAFRASGPGPGYSGLCEATGKVVGDLEVWECWTEAGKGE